MHWIGSALIAAGAVVALRWWLARSDALGRRRSFPLVSVPILVVCGCAALTPGLLRMRLEGRLSAAASEVAGIEVQVVCQSFGEAFTDVGAEYGYVAFGPDGIPDHSALIKRDQCGALSDYLGSDKRTQRKKRLSPCTCSPTKRCT